MAKAPSTIVKQHITPAEVRAAIHKICRDKNYDPFVELIELATETQELQVGDKTITVPVATVDQRITIAKELAQYMAPKLKSMEIEGQVDMNFQITVKRFGDDKIAELPANTANRLMLQEALSEGQDMLRNRSGNVED